MFLNVIHPTKEENGISYYNLNVIAKRGLVHQFGNEGYDNVRPVEKKCMKNVNVEFYTSLFTTSINKISSYIFIADDSLRFIVFHLFVMPFLPKFHEFFLF